MLRSSFVIFVCGWIAWFMLDKSAASQFNFPSGGGRMSGNFQLAVDMLKTGYPSMGFIYLWKHHYIILSLLGGAMTAVVIGSVGDYLGRRRMRKLILPQAVRVHTVQATETEPGPVSAPVPATGTPGSKD